jgi:hypothetical protein
MFIETVQRFADICNCDASLDLTGLKGGKVSNLLSEHTETNCIHNRTTVGFVLESVSKN